MAGNDDLTLPVHCVRIITLTFLKYYIFQVETVPQSRHCNRAGAYRLTQILHIFLKRLACNFIQVYVGGRETLLASPRFLTLCSLYGLGRPFRRWFLNGAGSCLIAGYSAATTEGRPRHLVIYTVDHFFFFLSIKSSLNFPLFPFIHLVVLLEAGRTPTSQFVAMIIADVAVRVAGADVEAQRRYAALAARVSTSGLRAVPACTDRSRSFSVLSSRSPSLSEFP